MGMATDRWYITRVISRPASEAFRRLPRLTPMVEKPIDVIGNIRCQSLNGI
jgi:hypothetical protein